MNPSKIPGSEILGTKISSGKLVASNSSPVSLQPTFLTQAWRHKLWIILLMMAVMTLVLSSGIGAVNIPMSQVLRVLTPEWLQSLLPHGATSSVSLSNINERIVMELRLPRILLAFVAGAGLSISGCVLQNVTRNPLADPYLFGISSGAAFGAVLVLTVVGDLHGWVSLPLGAFVGASLSVLLVLGLSSLGVSQQTERMLLSGVAISFMFGALSSLVLYFSTPQAAASVLFWTLGSFAKASWQGLGLPLTVVSLAIVVIIAFKRQINALLAGDETAHTLGVSVSMLRLGMLLLCSVVTATLVANCGGIGFVGLMIPHICRRLFPGRDPVLLAAVIGGLFMIWVDVLARSLLSTQELPVGIITAIIGSGFFLVILASGKR